MEKLLKILKRNGTGVLCGHFKIEEGGWRSKKIGDNLTVKLSKDSKFLGVCVMRIGKRNENPTSIVLTSIVYNYKKLLTLKLIPFDRDEEIYDIGEFIAFLD